MSKNAIFAENAQPQGSGTFQYFDVSKIDIDPATNGRFEGYSEEETRGLALDILARSTVDRGRLFHGQISPVTVSRTADNVPFLVAGFGRCGAIDYINANSDDAEIKAHLARLGLLDSEGNLERPFPVKAILAPMMTEEELEDYNLAENADRKDLTPMDWAIQIGRYAKRGWNDGQIAAHLSKFCPNGRATITNGWIAKHRYLLEMSAETQRAVHRREIPIDRAVELWRNARDTTVADESADGGARKPTPEEVHAAMDEQIGAVKDPETGKIDTAALRERNRQQNAQRGSKATLTIAEFVKILEKGIAANSAAAKTIYAAIKGKINEADFLSWLAESAGPEIKPIGEDKPAALRRGGGKGKGKAGTQVDLAAVQSAVKSAEKPTPATDENGIRLPPRAAGKGRGRKPSGDKTAEAPAAETPAAE